jgi:hypothetical protein
MSRAERGEPARSTGLIWTRIVSCEWFAYQRRDGRIAGIAAIPIAFAVDLDRLEHGREAGRRQQHVRRDLAVSEHPAASGADIGGSDEQLDRCSGQPVEIDDLGQDVAQGIGAARTEVVGREHPRHHIHGDEHGRIVERPAAQQNVQRTAPERAEHRRLRYPAPEILQRGARPRGAVGGKAVDQHRGVHRARRCARDAVDAQPGFLEQAVEHAPGESAVRAAALQREVHQNGSAARRHRACGHLVSPERSKRPHAPGQHAAFHRKDRGPSARRSLLTVRQSLMRRPAGLQRCVCPVDLVSRRQGVPRPRKGILPPARLPTTVKTNLFRPDARTWGGLS